MRIAEGLIAELEQEVPATRRVLERVPQAHLSWKPHAKSMSLGQLALHVATIPGNVASLVVDDTVPEPPRFIQPEAATSAELIPALEASVGQARSIVAGFDDARMNATWRLLYQGNELMALPRAAMLRMVMLNHWYHHRGQLLVYLRMHDVPLPSVYGPTADENPFAVAMAGATS
ncbi:MAG: DinB family protein [Vicinamibacterales bacterium]